MRLVALALVLAAGSARADAPVPVETTYVVEPGDTCLGIAVRVLGDRDQLDALHRVNPQLGPLPHDLVAGTILNLPPRTTTPDAQVTRARGDVKLRKASSSAWDVAVRGAFMFRAWRAWAGEQSTAELAFRDDSRLGMRERTIVVVYGPEKKLAKVITATAELAQGTLESRLGDLDGRPVVVRTPSAETDLRAGDVLVSAAVAGASIVANHRGTPVAVRGRGMKGKGVSVAMGMGSRVFPGKPPEPPRPLPATPTWTTTANAWVSLKGAPARAELAWTAVPKATTYRVAVRDAQGDEVLARFSATPSLAVELPLSPDPYRITVSAIDADGFEGAPSVPLPASLAEATVVPAGGTAALAEAPARITAGGTVVAPAGMTCRTGAGAASDRVRLATAGPTTISCVTAAGVVVAPFMVDVVGASIDIRGTRGDLLLSRGEQRTVAVDVATDGVIGQEISLEVTPGIPATITRLGPTRFEIALSASETAPARGTISIVAGGAVLASRTLVITTAPVPVAKPGGDRWHLGALAGFVAFGRGTDLGDPDGPETELTGGLLGGLRGGWSRGHVGFEAEVAFANAARASGGHETVLAGRVFAQLLRSGGATTVGVEVGGGFQRAASDTDPVGSIGVLAGYRVGRVRYRLDVRYDACSGSDGVAQGFDATVGAAIEFDR